MQTHALTPARTRRRRELATALRVAVEDLAQDGSATYTELSVAALAERANISRPTFYAYFRDKNDLLYAMAQDVFDEIAEAATGFLEASPFASPAALTHAVEAVAGAYRPHRMVVASVVEVATYDAELRAWYTSIVERAAAEFAAHIETGQREGWISRELHPLQAARWLVWTTERGLRRAHESPGQATAATLGALASMLWFTLYAKAR